VVILLIPIQQLVPQSKQTAQQTNTAANRGGAPPGPQSSSSVASFSEVFADSRGSTEATTKNDMRSNGKYSDLQRTDEHLNSDPVGKAIEELSETDAADSGTENPLDDKDTLPEDSDDLVAAFLAAIAVPADIQKLPVNAAAVPDTDIAEVTLETAPTTAQLDIPAIVAEQTNGDFVSIFEGKTSSVMPELPGNSDLTDITDDTARMPTSTSYSEVTEEAALLTVDTVQIPVVDFRGLHANPVSRPLENENELTATDKGTATDTENLGADAEPVAVQAVQRNDTAQSDFSDEHSDRNKDAELKTDPGKLDLTAKQLETDNRPMFTLESVDDSAVTNASAVRPSDLFDKVVESATLVRTDGVDKITLQLTPEHLGRVEIQLSLGEQGLTLKVSTEDAGVRGMLNSQLSQLISSLSDKGLKVVGAEVVYSGLAGDAFKENGGEQQGGTKQQSQSQRRFTASADVSAISAAFAYQAFFNADEEVTEFIA
jgi:hypothetical protein